MANTITLYDTVPGRVAGMGPIYTYKCVYDGTAGLEDIHTPDSDKRAFVVGLKVVEGGAATTVTIGATTTGHLPIEFGQNDGILKSIDNSVLWNTPAGEKLVMSSSAACTVFIDVVEGKGPDFRS